MQQIHEGKPLYVGVDTVAYDFGVCLLYTSPSPRDR